MIPYAPIKDVRPAPPGCYQVVFKGSERVMPVVALVLCDDMQGDPPRWVAAVLDVTGDLMPAHHLRGALVKAVTV